MARRWRSVLGGDDLAIGSADAERDRTNEHRAALDAGDPEFLELDRVGNTRLNRQRPHGLHRRVRLRRNHTRSRPHVPRMLYVAFVGNDPANEIHVIVVMGVAGAGKTTVGRALADALCWTLYDADEFHSA